MKVKSDIKILNEKGKKHFCPNSVRTASQPWSLLDWNRKYFQITIRLEHKEWAIGEGTAIFIRVIISEFLMSHFYSIRNSLFVFCFLLFF